MKKLKYFIYSTFFYFYSTAYAHAYLDPGTSSIIISTMIAFVVAAWSYVKLYFLKIKKFILKVFQSKDK